MSAAKLHLKAQHAWLVDAMVRHLAAYVTRYRTAETKQAPERFDGINETAFVVLLSRIFEGLGFATFYEQKVYGDEGWRLDLWAEELAVDRPRWLVEAKVIWDGDVRLGRNEFTADGAILGDLTRLAAWKREPGRKLAVWLAFSKAATPPKAITPNEKLRLQDAMDAVTKLVPSAHLDSFASVHLEPFGPCTEAARFAHVCCWEAA